MRQQDISNIEFRVADADQTQLPREEYNLVYARFLLCHLPDPVRALHYTFD